MLPAISAAPVGPVGEGHREVERADDGEHAVRPEDRAGVDGRVAEVAHRVVVAVVVLHRLRVVAQQVGRLLDLAERLDPVLADLDRHVGGVRHQVVADVLGRPADDREPLAPRDRGPGRLGGARRGDRGVDVGGRRASRTSRRSMSRSIGERASNVLGAVAPLAVDVVLVVPAELGLGLGDGRLEAGVELLVVGAQGRVGDLDARLRNSVVMVEGPRGRSVSRKRCGQSSAATTSASVGGDAVRAAARVRDAAVARASAGRSCPTAPGPRAARRAGRPRRRRAGRRRPSRTLTAGSRSPRSARSPATAWRKTSGDGLPRIRARRPVANSSPATNAAGVEGLALSASATTGCGASPAARRRRGRAGTRRPGSGTTGRRPRRR